MTASFGTDNAANADLRTVVEALGRIEQRLDKLEQVAQGALASGRDALGLLTDSVDRKVADAQARGLDVDQRLANLARAAEHLSSDQAIALLETTFGRLDRIQRVLESGVLDAAAISVVAQAGRALADTAAEPRHPIGPLGLLRALSEPEVRAALGLLLGFARRMGGALRTEAAAPELPAPTHALVSSTGASR